MKGIIFNLVEEIVSREHGKAAWDDLLDGAGLDGAYTPLGSYPDAHLVALVDVASSKFAIPADDVVRWIGRSSLPIFAERYPDFFASHATTRSFLLTLNDIIHPQVRTLFPDAVVPWFDFDTPSPDVLTMGYDSPRRMCAFAEGLIEGAADHFGEDVSLSQLTCMKEGDPKCLLQISFASSPAR
jgi:Haem-NO-binding